MRTLLPVIFVILTMTFGCGNQSLQSKEGRDTMSVSESVFGQTPEGQDVKLFTFVNKNGLVLKLTDYGALVISVEVPDQDGKIENVTLGFPSLDGYLEGNPFFGATVGRFCNRIGNASFTLDGKTYQLAANDGNNHLHGGLRGFDKVIWGSEIVEETDSIGVRFTYRSPDGEEGYPGNVDVSVSYLLTSQDELRVDFSATSDQATPLNLTNHNYWNLAGRGSILDHVLQLECDNYLVVDQELIPTGEIGNVEGTPLDFRSPQTIGSRVQDLKPMIGYDHCFIIRPHDGMVLAARVENPENGRVMEVWTTQPAIQFYSGNFLNGSKSVGGYRQYEGFCLETQHYPDSPNKPEFPSTVLRPGDTFKQSTIHKFMTK